MEIRFAAILAGDVAAEPVVELIAETDAVDAGGIETEGLRAEWRCRVAIVRDVEVLHALLLKSDVAAQIPAAEILDGGGVYHRRRRRKAYRPQERQWITEKPLRRRSEI